MTTQGTGRHRRRDFGILIGLGLLLGTLLAAPVAVGAAENWFELGLSDLKKGRYQDAIDKFSLALEAVPDDFEALNNRGFARIYIGDYDGAIEDCTRSLAINSGSAKAYNNRGFARIFAGDLETAIRDFDRAIAINPRYVDAYSNRCLARTRRGDYPQAIADCTEALHLNPRSAKALYNRGFARDRQGSPGGAMRDYIQALKVNPEFIEVFNNMAWIMATSPDERLRDGRRAVAYAEKAVAGAPDINFLDTLAAAYAEAGRFDEAVAIENRIISLLASARMNDAIPAHVKRMSIYEEGRPYRDPITIEPVSAVTDLKGELAALDKLVFAPEVTSVAYEPDEAARNFTAEAAEAAQAAGANLLAQTESKPAVSVPEAQSQSVQTSPGVPVEISLGADPDGIPMTFEIETVPYHGALQGTLPNLLYTPRPGFEGVDRFTFRARNAAGLSNLATVTISVSEPAAAPAVEEAPAASEPAPGRPPEAPLVAPSGTAPAERAPEPEDAARESSIVDAPEAVETESVAAPQDTTASDAAPSTPASEAEPEPELSPETVYTIQVYSVKEAAGAQNLVTGLVEEGYEAFSLAVEVPEMGVWHRIFIGGFASMAAAREALAQLDPERFEDAFIRRMPGGARVPAAAPAPKPAVPAAKPDPATRVPAENPAPEPSLPAAAPEPEPAQPAKAPEPAPSVPATKPAPEPVVPAAPAAPPDDPAPGPASQPDAENQAIAVKKATYPYAYQVKSYKQRDDAFQLAVELTTQGNTAFIGRGTLGSTGVWYRVYVGCYQTPEEAERNRSDIARLGFPEAFLTPIAFTIAVTPDSGDPAGETLENRLMASGFLPYRLPADNEDGPPSILVGGFRNPEDAATVLATLEQSGFTGYVRPR